MPKEIRKPKSEPRIIEDVLGQDSAFWTWGDDSPDQTLFLHDGDSGAVLPRDLMERTAQFGEAIIRFSKKIPQTPENIRLIGQLVGAGTSIGANYCEADDAVSGKDFKKSIGTCRKESKETMFFLRMIATSEETLKEEARELWREAKELNLIFGSIWRK
jgi:four helix bundle protein